MESSLSGIGRPIDAGESRFKKIEVAEVMADKRMAALPPRDGRFELSAHGMSANRIKASASSMAE